MKERFTSLRSLRRPQPSVQNWLSLPVLRQDSTLKAQLTQGTGAPTISPVTQSLALQVGTYSVTIPAGSFVAKKNGSYVYAGNINGVTLQVRILEIRPISYQVQVTASGVDLTSLAAPIPVTLSLGYNTGTSM